MKEENWNSEKEYEVVCLAGHPYLFTDIRLNRDSVPEDMRAYDVAEAECDGRFHRASSYVCVDYWCTCVGFYELPEPDGMYYCKEPDGCFLDEMVTEEEFRERYSELLDACRALEADTEKERSACRAMSDEDLIDAMFSLYEEYTSEGYWGATEEVGTSVERECLYERVMDRSRSMQEDDGNRLISLFSSCIDNANEYYLSVLHVNDGDGDVSEDDLDAMKATLANVRKEFTAALVEAGRQANKKEK